MKRLTLLRHAKSSWDAPGLQDFDRPLNKRGREAARLVGRELSRRKLRFDLVLASPAMRVRETLEELADGFGSALDIRFEPRIYLADPDTLLDLVRGLSDGHRVAAARRTQSRTARARAAAFSRRCSGPSKADCRKISDRGVGGNRIAGRNIGAKREKSPGRSAP